MKNNSEGRNNVPLFLIYSISVIDDLISSADYYHHCFKIMVSLDNSFESMIDGQSLSGLRGFIVNQTIAHSCFSPDANVLISFVEINSALGKYLNALLDGKPWINLESILPAENLNHILPENYNEMSNKELIPYVDAFLNSLIISGSVNNIANVDERVQQALDYIEYNLHNIQELEVIETQIKLPLQIASTLFMEQIGIPLEQYVMWQRILKTMQATIAEGNNLSDACVRFGFKDESDFNKKFKRIFGISAFKMIHYSRVLL